MFGRAGRRGIDEMGFVLISANEIRMRDGYPCQLARSGMADWSALLGLMSAAAQREEDPFAEAVRVQERLFTTKPIFLGVEESMKHPDTPCGLPTDAERARHVRRRVREMLNSRGEWEPYPKPTERPLRDIVMMERPRQEPPLSQPFAESPGRESSELSTRIAPRNLRAAPSPPPIGRGCPEAGKAGGSWAEAGPIKSMVPENCGALSPLPGGEDQGEGELELIENPRPGTQRLKMR